MRKRLVIAVGLFAVFLLLVVVATFGATKASQTSARGTATLFIQAFTKGDASAVYNLFTPGMQDANPLNANGNSSLQTSLATDSQQFDGQKPKLNRIYVSDDDSDSGDTVAEYSLTNKDKQQYTVSIVLIQQSQQAGGTWDVADFQLTQNTTK